MLATEVQLYLPISEGTLSGVLDNATDWVNTVQGLDIPEIASLFVLANLPKLCEHQHIPAVRLLAATLESCNEQASSTSLSTLIKYALQNLNRLDVSAGYALLPSFKIALLSDEAIERRDYLSHSGQYDLGFQNRYSESLTDRLIKTRIGTRQGFLNAEQSRVYREFEAQQNEHSHIQGYAGTGKTSLIKSLLTLFGNSKACVLVLVARQIQLSAMRAEFKNTPHVHIATFIDLANMLMPEDHTSAASQNMRINRGARATMSDDAVVLQLGVRASGNHSALQLVQAIRSTVFRFCQSVDTSVMEKHIPAAQATSFDASTLALVHHFACKLWQTLLLPPTKDFKPPIKGYHKIKWAALHGRTIPVRYTHVMLDECHDLPPTVLQILARSPQARSTLGDDYQNLSGQTVHQTSCVRIREMVHSVRSGPAVENIVNKIIMAHPSSMKAEFKGNTLSTLKVDIYQKPAIPDTPALILVNDNWGLFEWVQRLASQNINIQLKSSHADLNRFVQDCFELKNGGDCARHGELFRFKSWDTLADVYQHRAGFRRFNQLLEKGYEQKNWDQTYKRLLSAPDSRSYVISQIENVRNLEFDSVMLTPDIFESADRMSKAAFSASIYVCVTRARRQLLAPETLYQWVERISQTGRVDQKSSRGRRS